MIPLHGGHGSAESAFGVADLVRALSALILMALYLAAAARLRIEVALAVVLATQWYAASGRALARANRGALPARAGTKPPA